MQQEWNLWVSKTLITNSQTCESCESHNNVSGHFFMQMLRLEVAELCFILWERRDLSSGPEEWRLDSLTTFWFDGPVVSLQRCISEFTPIICVYSYLSGHVRDKAALALNMPTGLTNSLTHSSPLGSAAACECLQTLLMKRVLKGTFYLGSNSAYWNGKESECDIK